MTATEKSSRPNTKKPNAKKAPTWGEPQSGDRTELTRDAIAARLMQLRDELVVRNRLGAMELNDAVKELTNEVEKVAMAFAHKVEQGVAMIPEETKLRMQLAMLEGNRRLLAMESALQAALAGAARSAATIAETARMKASLARMDAIDVAEARRKDLKEELRKLEAQSDAVLHDIERRLSALGIDGKRPNND